MVLSEEFQEHPAEEAGQDKFHLYETIGNELDKGFGLMLQGHSAGQTDHLTFV